MTTGTTKSKEDAPRQTPLALVFRVGLAEWIGMAVVAIAVAILAFGIALLAR